MINIAEFGLKEKPFAHLPTDASTQHWAGMDKAKKGMEEIIVSVQPDDIGDQEFVIMHGTLGGGKTHALRYFSQYIAKEGYGYAFFVRKVRLAAAPSFRRLFLSIVDENKSMLPDLVGTVVKSIQSEAVKAMKPDATAGFPHDQDVYQQAIKKVIGTLVPSANQKLVTKFMKLGEKADEEGIANALTADVEDDYSAACTFASLIGVMTTKIDEQQPLYKAAYVFFDEMEDLLEVKYTQLFPFWGTCRELINRTAENRCAIVMAFTAEAAEVLVSQIPNFLYERLTRAPFELKGMDDDEAKKFVLDHLKSVRLEGAKATSQFSPFSEEVIDFLLERESEIVPRHLLKHMGNIFERAARREMVRPGEDIPRDMAQEILAGMIL